MEIKIQCDCGTRFKFDVEPEEGRMPVEVHCPECGVDATPRANAIIAESSVRTGSIGGGSELAAGAPKLRIARQAEEPPLAESGPAPPAPPLPTTAHPPRAPAASSGAKPRKVMQVYADPNPWRGLLGAVIGAAIATAFWYGLWKGTDSRWGIMAIAVGWMAGFCARWMGRTEGQNMALMTVGVALLFILGFQYVRASAEMSQWRLSPQMVDELYEDELKGARKIVTVIPNGTDQEIRLFLAREMTEEGESPNLDLVSNQLVKDFREGKLQEARAIASGKKTKEDLRAEWKKNEDELHKTPILRAIFWVKALGIFNIIAILVGLAAAYKFGYGEG